MAQYLNDIGNAWWVLLLSSIIALITAYVYLVAVRYCGGVIIWTGFIFSLIVLAAMGGYTYGVARPAVDPESQTYQALTYTSYVLWGLDCILLITLCCCGNAIKLGIAVFACTVQFIQNNMEIFVLPAISTLVSLIWTCLWIVGAVYIFSVGEPEPREGFPFITEVKWSWKTKGVFSYHFFGLLWINAFIVGAVQFMIAAATCIWYFECQTDTKGRRTLKRASWWLARFHWASIAFGALVIAICQAVRAAFEYYRRKTKTLDQSVKWVKVLLCMTSYILYLMEKCVKYISKNAYI